MQHDQGILNGTTAFGKTVTAIGLIAERKVNTLILVHTRTLLEQWEVRLEEFLELEYPVEEAVPKRGRKSIFSLWYVRFQRKQLAWMGRCRPHAILLDR